MESKEKEIKKLLEYIKKDFQRVEDSEFDSKYKKKLERFSIIGKYHY
jgi:hypothetical protein